MGGSGGLIAGIPDLAAILASVGNLMTSISGPSGVLSTLAGLTGAFFIFQALHRAYAVSQPSGRGAEGEGGVGVYIMSPLVFGAMLTDFWVTQQQVSDTLKLSGGVLSPVMPAAYLSTMWSALVVVMHGFGYISIFRAILLLKSAADGSSKGHESPIWGGFWHVLGGALLVNL